MSTLFSIPLCKRPIKVSAREFKYLIFQPGHAFINTFSRHYQHLHIILLAEMSIRPQLHLRTSGVPISAPLARFLKVGYLKPLQSANGDTWRNANFRAEQIVMAATNYSTYEAMYPIKTGNRITRSRWDQIITAAKTKAAVAQNRSAGPINQDKHPIPN